MSVDAVADQHVRDLQRNYLDFFDDNDKYSGCVRDLIESRGARIIVNVNDLRRKFPDRAKGLIEDSSQESIAAARALKEYIASVDSDFAKSQADFYVGFEGSFGPLHLTPRSLTASHLNHMVCLEGIVTKASVVKPKIVRSVHYCPATKKTTERAYSDLTSLDPFPSTAAYPTQDEDGNPLQTEYGLSTYQNYQSLTVQEVPEKAPTGQLPRSVDVVCDNDLVDLCKPGDRVQIVGSYRCLPGKKGGFTSGTFRSVLLANNVILQAVQDGPEITGADVEMCRKFAKKNKNVFEILAKSLAPSIHGHDYVKRALLCQLLGGVEKHLPNGSRLRGDINVLLIGDPSVAKSQMLRYVLATSTRAVTTTGRGSSGVGLTAAVTTDQETGERHLEAGAMVLADRGIVCIDEFDKMSDMDRTAIHEVMEQGRVTISKAGIHARLNARCSVLAAANPVYGRYDPFKTPMENIGLQDSLLSRFDLLFVLLDTVDIDNDKKIADHVVRIHRYRSPHEVDGAVSGIVTGFHELGTASKPTEDRHDPKDIWDKHDKLLNPKTSSSERLLNLNFVKKYIEIAKHMKPVLTDAACEAIGEEYSRLRATPGDSKEQARTQPITARCLETMIRLSTAHAKARLSKTIEKKDAAVAIGLVQYAYFKHVLEKEKKRGVDSDEESDEMEQDADSEPPQAKRRRQEEPSTSSGPIDISEVLPKFMAALDPMYHDGRVQQVSLRSVLDKMKSLDMDERTVRACIQKMEGDNQVMLSDGELYRM